MVVRWVPDPLCVGEPPVGSRSLVDVVSACCVKWQCRGTLGGVGGTLVGVGGAWAPLGGFLMLVLGVVWGSLVVPFPLTASLPTVGSRAYQTNSPSGLREIPRI